MSTMPNRESAHDARIRDQFSRQAMPFAAMPAHSNAEGFELLARSARLGAEDVVLDVACGPGLVACAMAPRVKALRGLDLTPQMLEQARARAAARELHNVDFDLGDCTRLPYADGAFSRVITRYSFHHLLAPVLALREMVRVCRPGGTVTVCDAAPAHEKLDAYNALEKIRDPSHAAALCPEALEALFSDVGLWVDRREQYRLEVAVEELISASFPDAGGGQKMREIFEKDLGVNALGVAVERRQGGLWFSFPILILSATKSGPAQ